MKIVISFLPADGYEAVNTQCDIFYLSVVSDSNYVDSFSFHKYSYSLILSWQILSECFSVFFLLCLYILLLFKKFLNLWILFFSSARSSSLFSEYFLIPCPASASNYFLLVHESIFSVIFRKRFLACSLTHENPFFSPKNKFLAGPSCHLLKMFPCLEFHAVWWCLFESSCYSRIPAVCWIIPPPFLEIISSVSALLVFEISMWEFLSEPDHSPATSRSVALEACIRLLLVTPDSKQVLRMLDDQ
jgi:hypothetical protein